MRIFITGASGFIGGAIAKAMAGQHEVFAMSRSRKSDFQIRDLGAYPARCDLATLEPGDIPRCDVVIHCAASVETWSTKEVMEHQCRGNQTHAQCGASRFLHISTEAVLWKGQDLIDVDESYPYPKTTRFSIRKPKQRPSN